MTPGDISVTRSTRWALTALSPAPAPRPDPSAHDAPILRHHRLTGHYWFLRLHAPYIAESAQPGQFVMLTAARTGESAPVLPRPMAIYRTAPDHGTIDILYGVVGTGTAKLSGFLAGETMLAVGPLGRGFDLAPEVRSVLLIGRGIGTCSLTTVAQHAKRTGVAVTAVTSARYPGAIIGADLYREFGALAVHEVDDAAGTSAPDALFALLTDELDADIPHLLLTCGSSRLIGLTQRLADRWARARIQVSIEAHMACGLGYCHGCSSGARGAGVETPLVCADGPVFEWARVVDGGER